MRGARISSGYNCPSNHSAIRRFLKVIWAFEMYYNHISLPALWWTLFCTVWIPHLVTYKREAQTTQNSKKKPEDPVQEQELLVDRALTENVRTNTHFYLHWLSSVIHVGPARMWRPLSYCRPWCLMAFSGFSSQMVLCLLGFFLIWIVKFRVNCHHGINNMALPTIYVNPWEKHTQQAPEGCEMAQACSDHGYIIIWN